MQLSYSALLAQTFQSALTKELLIEKHVYIVYYCDASFMYMYKLVTKCEMLALSN